MLAVELRDSFRASKSLNDVAKASGALQYYNIYFIERTNRNVC